MFETLGSDVRDSLRRLRRRPTRAAPRVLTLALGVAGTAAVYGIARRLLLEPLPTAAARFQATRGGRRTAPGSARRTTRSPDPRLRT